MLRLFLTHASRISQWTGKAVCWLMLILVCELVYDTIARYAFNSPTIWSFDISYILYSLLFMLGGAYTLHEGGHIRVDFLYEKMSSRTRALIDIICSVIFFFPALGALFYYGIRFTAESWAILEHSNSSYWSPPIYYFKAVIPVSAFLLLLQGTVDFIRNAAVLVTGKES
jgi:TRAP-type mannitol/chloroaromatic compound transport system permease small subunit